MTRRAKRPTKKDREAEGRAILARLPKLSETMLQFAKPLLDQAPNPPTIELLRGLLITVTVAWNLPVYEQTKHPLAASFRAAFDRAQAVTPAEIREIVSAMLASRLTTYASDPRVGFIEAVDEGGGRARIHATATLMEHVGGGS